MIRLPVAGVPLILPIIAALVGCQARPGSEHSPEPARAAVRKVEKAGPEPELTPEQARAALLKVENLPRYSKTDPILKDLKSGPIRRTGDAELKIGDFFSCNLKEKTWRMGFGIRGATPKGNFACGAKGTFVRQPDGTWIAVMTEDYIT